MLFPSFACSRTPPSRAFAVLASLSLILASPAAAAELTLADALGRVVTADPSITAAAARLQAAGAAVRQAGVRPRDTVGVDLEDFAGTGRYPPIDRSQTTAWYERTFERGGKRDARIGAARAEMGVTRLQGRLRLLDLLAQVQTAWVEALAAEAAVPLAEQRLAVARRVQGEVARRVGRALDPLFAGERARSAVAEAEIARASLAAWWGGTADYRLDPAPFEQREIASAGAAALPDLAALAAERDAADARLRLSRSGDVGDPTLRAGVRHFGEDNAVALVVGGSIPLGSRQANRGNVDKAEADRRLADAEIAIAERERGREIDRLTAQRTATVSEIARIERDVLPSARRAVVLVCDGFNRGGTAFTLLELSEAQRAVTDAARRRVELLRRFHLDGARLDRLTGRHLPLLAAMENR
jgi:cobalt-zinc-cadmium efflux system outer membrane protein